MAIEEVCQECKNTNGEHLPGCSYSRKRADFERIMKTITVNGIVCEMDDKAHEQYTRIQKAYFDMLNARDDARYELESVRHNRDWWKDQHKERTAEYDAAIAERDAARAQLAAVNLAVTEFANTMVRLSPHWTPAMAEAWTTLFAVVDKE